MCTGIGKFSGDPYSSNQMSNLQDMHQDVFLFICRMLSTRKSGIWNSLEFWSQSKKLLNGPIAL